MLAIEDWSWTEELLEDEKNSPLLKAKVEVESDIKELERIRIKSFKERKDVDRILKLINTIMQKDLIGFCHPQCSS